MRPPFLTRVLVRLVGRFLSGPELRALLSELDEAASARHESPRDARARRNRELGHALWALLIDEARNRVPSARHHLTGPWPSTRGDPTMRILIRDLRHAARRLRRSPVFSATVVLTVGLGIGGAAAAFGVVDAVLIRPLPYPRPDELVEIGTVRGSEQWRFSMADYLALAEQQTHFAGVAAFDPNGITLAGPEGAERIDSYSVTPGFLPLLGVDPLLGRGFAEEESLPTARDVAVLSWGLWQTRFGGDAHVIGRSLTLDERPFEVIGVLPREVGPVVQDRDVLVNLRLVPPPRKGPFMLRVLGRMPPGADPGVATTELRAINARIFPIWQASYSDRETTWGMKPLREAVLGDVGRSLWIVMAAVTALLLLASTNAANLVVARAVERRRDLAVRAALGASRRRLVGQLMAESGILAAASALLGFGLTTAGLRLAARAGAGFIPRASEIHLTWRVGLLVLAVTGGAFLLFGVTAAVQGALRGGASSLQGRDRGGTETAGARRLRSALVAFQFAVATPLLIGGALLLQSLRALSSVDPGFDADHVAMVGVALPAPGYEERDAVLGFWDRVVEEVEALPGVEVAGASNGKPPDDPGFGENFILEDRPLAAGESQPSLPMTIADGGYFQALGVPLLAGRLIGPDDPPRSLLVDERWATRFFGGPEGAVGRRVLHGGCTVPGDCPWWTVVGVVGTVAYNGLSDADRGAMYLDAHTFPQRGAYLAIRVARGDPSDILPVVRRIVRDAEPRAPVTSTATGRELLRNTLRGPRYLTSLVAAFAGVSLLLVVVGIYGIMAYFVERSRKEIGIRLALGGAPRSVVSMVLWVGLRLAALGTAAGVLLALALSRTVQGALFQVDARDPATLLLVPAGLLAVALVGCWDPARRAAGVDPGTSLRE